MKMSKRNIIITCIILTVIIIGTLIFYIERIHEPKLTEEIIVNNTTFNTAMVSDGWDNGVYYLNLDTSQYSDLKGTVFKL